MDIVKSINGLEPVPLAALPKGSRGRVASVVAADSTAVSEVSGSTISRRLVEVGFVTGESIEVLATVQPGGDPIAVRIGASIFALRRREAQAVMVAVDPPGDDYRAVKEGSVA